MSGKIIFVDDVERAGWFAVVAGVLTREDNAGYAVDTADWAVTRSRTRHGRDLQAENAQLRQDLADARATVDRLHDELTARQAELDSPYPQGTYP